MSLVVVTGARRRRLERFAWRWRLRDCVRRSQACNKGRLVGVVEVCAPPAPRTRAVMNSSASLEWVRGR
jgi:hypothetical protein